MRLIITTLFQVIAFVLCLLPRQIQLFLGWILGILVFDVFRIRRSVIMSNLMIAYPSQSNSELVKIGRASMVSQGRILIEYFMIMVYSKEQVLKRVTWHGTEYLEEALKQGKGAFLLTLHMGNGDFAGVALSSQGYPFHLITKKAKQGILNDVWFGLRTRLGVKLISHEKSSFEILKALKANHFVGMVLDQYMGPPIGVKTRFFGKETGTAQGLAIFAGRTGTPVIPSYNYRRPDGGFDMIFEKPIPFVDKSDHETTIQHMTQVYTDKLEEIVKKKPEQWMWIHRRWKNFG